MVDSVGGSLSRASVPLGGVSMDAPVKVVSPYAGGGGGTTFAHYVAATYVAGMLLGEGRDEIDQLQITQVHFQVPGSDVDDLLIVGGTGDDETRVWVAARRSPNFVRSHAKTRELVASLVREVQRAGDDDQIRVAVAVAEWTNSYSQVQELAALARENIDDEASFHRQVHTPGRRDEPLRNRYGHLSDLVSSSTAPALTEQDIRLLTWRLLKRLWILQFRVEVADEADWSAAANALNRIARPPFSGVHLRDRLLALCAKWDLLGTAVNERVVRRRLRTLLGDHARFSDPFQAALDDAEKLANHSVRSTIGTAADEDDPVHVERTVLSNELGDALLSTAKGRGALIVTGESGTGKSSLVLSTVQRLESRAPDVFEAVVVNLRYTSASISAVRSSLSTSIIDALKDSRVEARVVVVDAADAVLENHSAVFGELVRDARAASAGLVAVSADTAVSHVRDQVSTRFGDVHTLEIPPLSDDEITRVADKIPSLSGLLRNLPQRSLLRRLVVLDLLARAGLTVHGALSGWGCLEIVWRGLVRRNENIAFGSPEGRERALLALAERELGLSAALPWNTAVDPSAIDALRRDHLLAPFNIHDPQPQFAHDEVRRYAVALVLFRSGAIARALEDAGVPRWAMSAAQLACQGWLLRASIDPLATFAEVRQGFVDIADRYGSRWADIPVEAALESPRAYEHLRGLPLTASAESAHGLDGVIRVVEQRQIVGGLIDIDRGEPLVRVLLDHERSWLRSESVFTFVAAWLQALVAAETPAGNSTRQLLRTQLIDHWREHYEPPADISAVDLAEPADRPFEKFVRRGMRRRQRGCLDYRLTDERLVELLALLGADIDARVEEILILISEYAPARLAPAADSPWSARAVAQHSTDLLQVLMETYYIDLDSDSGGLRENGIREHWGRWSPIGPPFAAYWFGGFWQLFPRARLVHSASVLNKILNHAARWRVRDREYFAPDTNGQRPTAQDSTYSMSISGHERRYVGDGATWSWYRGSGVGPYPCMSALQAMERILDQYIDAGLSMSTIVRILLTDCENLAVPALLLGAMVRHIEVSQDAIEPFLTEPIIWIMESGRIPHEYIDVHAPNSDELINSERRTIQLQQVCMQMVLDGDQAKRDHLRSLGGQLAEKGIAIGLGTEAAGWAACLDFDRFQAHRIGDQLLIEVEPPEQVAQRQAQWEPDIHRYNTLLRLQNRYATIYRCPGEDYIPPDAEEIAADLAVAEDLLESPPSMSASDPLDTAAHVASAAIYRADSATDQMLDSRLSFAVKLIMSIASAFADGEDRSDEDQYFSLGADRAAAHTLPLLLLPRLSNNLTAAGFTVPEVDRAATALISKSSLETRLYLARGCDRVWTSPCHGNPCHHHIALGWLPNTGRTAEIGPWDAEGRTRASIRITGNLIERLTQLDDESIDSYELDAAIRGFGAAAASTSCVSEQATAQLHVLLQAQERAMVSHDKAGFSVDHHQVQSLVAARALVHAAIATETEWLSAHLTALRGSAHLFANFLHMLAAVGAETPELGRCVRLAWPTLVEHALTLSVGTPNPYNDHTWGDWALAALIPRPAAWTDGLYNEIEGKPFDWVAPDDLIGVIPQWVKLAHGRTKCVDNLISLLHKLSPGQQAILGLQWVADLCVHDNHVRVHSSPVLNEWLIGLHREAEAHQRLAQWQKLVDQLVAAGNRQLAQYSV